MPVAFTATPGLDVNLGYRYEQPRNAPELLQQCSKEEYAKCEKILRSSFSDDYLSSHNVKASPNGFVWAVIETYNEHHGLIIRPDDVWLAILTQFSLYVNAHAKEHRRKFVAHDGQIELKIKHDGPIESYDWAELPQVTAPKLGQLFADPDFFQHWILPEFSTTKVNDTIVCSIVMMSTMQHYERYTLYTRCGLPTVTLLVSHFVKAFENPDSTENKEFWQKVAQQTKNMGGVDYLAGWLTAFCFWDEQGQGLHGNSFYKYTEMYGVNYSWVDINKIPPGFAAVPVKIDNNGLVYSARMVAGSIATRGYVSHKGFPTGNKGCYDTLQSEVGWCVFKLKGKVTEDDISGADEHPNPNSDVADDADSRL